MRSGNRRYVPMLDVLRGLAAWWVVSYHTVIRYTPAGALPVMWTGSRNPALIVFSQGWLAVSVFVMLSGYSLSMGLREGDTAWPRFFQARWLRVAPLYLLVLVLSALAAPATDPPTPGSFLAAVTMLPIPGAFTPGPWLATAWSVRVEFALYLFIPALVHIARRRRPMVSVVMAGIFAVVVLAALLRTASTIEVLYWGVPGRLLEFAVGFALGWRRSVAHVRLRWLRFAVAGTGFAALALWANRAGGFLLIPGTTRGELYVGSLLCGALLLTAVDRRGRAVRSTVPRAASAVGSWSYSTYLWHAVVINLLVAPLLFDRPSGLGFHAGLAAGLVLTAAIVLPLSWASFHLVEKPFLSMRPRYVAATAEAGVPMKGRLPTERAGTVSRVLLPPVPAGGGHDSLRDTSRDGGPLAVERR